MKNHKNIRYRKKQPSVEVLAERVRLCERAIDNMKEDKRDFNKKLSLIIVFSLTLSAFILTLDFATYEKEMNNPLYAEYKEIMAKAWMLKLRYELGAYFFLGIASLIAMFGHFPIILQTLDISCAAYKKHYGIKFLKKYIIEHYEDIIITNQRKMNLYRVLTYAISAVLAVWGFIYALCAVGLYKQPILMMKYLG